MEPKIAKALSFSDLKIISEYAERVFNMSEYNAKKDCAETIAEYWAYEIITLSELMSPKIEYTKHIANKVLEDYKFPVGTITPIRKHFDLPY